MSSFIDDGDARLPSEFPRISERYRASANVVWYPPSRRKLISGKPSAVTAYLLDLSVAGALLKATSNPKIKTGSRVRFELNGQSGIAEVRNSRPAGEDSSYFGISFFSLTDELKGEIFDLVANVRSEDFQELWQRSI